MNLRDVALELGRRLSSTFLPDENGRRPCHGDDPRWAKDPHWKDLVLFHEYFHGDTGRGVGASHQTGWTALVLPLLRDVARARPVSKPRKQPKLRPTKSVEPLAARGVSAK
jgi:hypothetical protein